MAESVSVALIWPPPLPSVDAVRHPRPDRVAEFEALAAECSATGELRSWAEDVRRRVAEALGSQPPYLVLRFERGSFGNDLQWGQALTPDVVPEGFLMLSLRGCEVSGSVGRGTALPQHSDIDLACFWEPAGVGVSSALWLDEEFVHLAHHILVDEWLPQILQSLAPDLEMIDRIKGTYRGWQCRWKDIEVDICPGIVPTMGMMAQLSQGATGSTLLDQYGVGMGTWRKDLLCQQASVVNGAIRILKRWMKEVRLQNCPTPPSYALELMSIAAYRYRCDQLRKCGTSDEHPSVFELCVEVWLLLGRLSEDEVVQVDIRKSGSDVVEWRPFVPSFNAHGDEVISFGGEAADEFCKHCIVNEPFTGCSVTKCTIQMKYTAGQARVALHTVLGRTGSARDLVLHGRCS